ncbi:DNA repair protein Rhp41 [Decorospora gaudefroyi]|uniref:DNA repair protein Rhp41 n=1 Tax=Decorospora gaudefroyi TaxID=184978 RepID=A0A6A5KKH3_9PLEO|nr:DNA repair protein Rhp41 [Decorospora gaudefroyi]
MAGTRRRVHKTTDIAAPRRSARTGKSLQQDEGVPAVFQEMLREEHASKAANADEDERPFKKRRTAPAPRPGSPVVGYEKLPQEAIRAPTSQSPAPSQTGSPSRFQVPSHTRIQPTALPQSVTNNETPASGRVRQTIVDSDESDDSDIEWEDALADGDDTDDADEVGHAVPQVGDISITMGGKKMEETKATRQVRRRAITSVDKKRRLDIHKMHLLCLLYHVHRRNTWCNDRRVQSTLRKMVTSKTLSNLVPNPDLTQYSASKQFVDGMNELKMMWSKRFKITAQGMYKPRWAEAESAIRPFSDFDDLDAPMDKDEFRNAAYTLQGSQDVGTQLFCALLRGIGIEVRLVCSLQPLPFSSAAERATPQKSGAQKNDITVDPYNKPAEASPTKLKSQAPRQKKLSRLERVMGERHAVLNKTGAAPKKQKAYHTPYPVYWVEAFNSAHQKWVSIDTHSTFTVNSPEKFEPPLNLAQNSLTYAIAFEEDYTAKDVTRRYAKAYSAKTRKFRVESTPDGDRWWRRTMRFFERASALDRDQVEDAALARKEAAEGIPRNVQDFKGHPVYVLERHLRHNEVIHPLNQVGKVNCGTAMNPKMEPIYRRTNVHLVRSADKWYRMGRDIKMGEQPLKRAKPKKGRRPSIGADMDVDEEADEVGAGLFAEFQTELYIPPPVVRGRVPRNAYGNLDLYVPSMCPPGGTHIRHKLGSKAARIAGVDYADAVTGFSFKGRHGTAIIQGVVVAQEYADAVQAVIDAMEYQQEEAETARRTAESLRLWRRFCLGLRIAQRVNAIEIDGEKGPVIDYQTEISKQDRELAAQDMAGGFFPDEADVTEPPARSYEPPQQDYGEGGFLPDGDADGGSGGGFVHQEDSHTVPISLNRHQSFESSILDSHQLLPRRRSSLGQAYSSDDDDNISRSFIHHDTTEYLGPSTHHPQTSNEALPQLDGAADEAPASIPEPASNPLTTQEPSEEDESTQRRDRELHHDNDDDIHVAIPSPSESLSPSDTGSLPMEDPEDEDADPDWLVDVT